MGTKGRDVAIYAYFFSFLGVIACKLTGWGRGTKLLLFFMLVSLFMLAYYYFVYRPCAIKKSREAGFLSLVFLPLYPKWAELLLHLGKVPLKANGQRAYEIHLELNKRKKLRELLKLIEEDLYLCLDKMPGVLLLWETHVPLPQAIRKIIRTEAQEGSAYWQKGRWPIPKPPFTYTNLKKDRTRYGAAVVSGKTNSRRYVF